MGQLVEKRRNSQYYQAVVDYLVQTANKVLEVKSKISIRQGSSSYQCCMQSDTSKYYVFTKLFMCTAWTSIMLASLFLNRKLLRNLSQSQSKFNSKLFHFFDKINFGLESHPQLSYSNIILFSNKIQPKLILLIK